MRQTNLLSVICVEKPEQLKQNNDTKAYKQKGVKVPVLIICFAWKMGEQ